MRYCKDLSGSLFLWPNCAGFCCTPENKHFPTIPFQAGFRFETIELVRDALIAGLAGDLSCPVQEYVRYGHPGFSNLGHPCRDCPRLMNVSEEAPQPAGQGMKIRRYLNILANGCNAKCDYCGSKVETYPWEYNDPSVGERAGSPELDYQILRQIIAAGGIAPSCEVSFSGGEPSLSEKCMKLLEEMCERKQKVGVFTNAIRFAPNIERALRQGHCRVTVNVDSGDRDKYRIVKGVDKFDTVLLNVDKYVGATQGESYFELRYIVYDKNNTLGDLTGFIDICVAHKIQHVALSLNYHEGGSSKTPVSNATFKGIAWLLRNLESKGINVRLDKMPHAELKNVCLAYADLVVSEERSTSTVEGFSEGTASGVLLSTMELEAPALRAYLTAVLRAVIPGSKNYALYGCGRAGEYTYALINSLRLDGPSVVLDRSPRPMRNGLQVLHPDQVNEQVAIDTVIVCSSLYHYQIYRQLTLHESYAKTKIIDPFFFPSFAKGDFRKFFGSL